jgi:hypothetical protein
VNHVAFLHPATPQKEDATTQQTTTKRTTTMTTFHANIAIMPATPGELLPEGLRELVSGTTITVDRGDYLELDMITETHPDWKWMESLSTSMPSLRIAMRGEDPAEGYVSFGFTSGGKVLRKRSEHGFTQAHLNMKAMLFPDWGISPILPDERLTVWTLINPFSNPTLLWHMENYLDLSPSRQSMLRDNPNYVEGFKPNLDWWLGRFRDC